MGIRFSCPNGHKLNVKTFLAGKRGVCPQCGATFVIPVPADLAAAEKIQPATVGQSHTLEVLAPPANSTASPAASQSIIIAVADAKASQPRAQTETTAPRSLNKAPAASPPASVPADMAPSIVAAPIVAPSQTPNPDRRASSRQLQAIVSALLFVLVIVLAIVLVSVLRRHANQTPGEKTPAAHSSEPGKTETMTTVE